MFQVTVLGRNDGATGATADSGSQTKAADCPHPVICVTSLNMRKWMRERLQRRKKKTTDEASQPSPSPAPLQPAYFEAGEGPKQAESGKAQPEPSAESTVIEPEAGPEPSASERSERTPAKATGSTVSPRGRSRRRRGGRGRGSSGREQSVAQAFTPAAVKGIVSDSPVETSPQTGEEMQPEIEPEAENPAPAVAPPIRAVPPRPPKGVVVLAIGLPGSGKSTWFKRHNVTPLSSDMMRSLLFDDIREQRFQDLVFSNLRSMLKGRLIARRPMNYVDATNLTPKEREHWIKLAKDYNYEVHAVFFDVPLEVCIERHGRRDRVVPDDAMRRMAAKLKPPTFDEGFAKITVVRVKKKSES